MFEKKQIQDLLSGLTDQTMVKDIEVSLERLIPKNTEILSSFARTYFEEDKLTFEISLLSNNYFIYDLTFDTKERRTSVLKLTSTMMVILTRFFSDGTEENLPKNSEEPYRLELSIDPGLNGLHYTVEGQTKNIYSLLDYYYQIIQALHQIKGVE